MGLIKQYEELWDNSKQPPDVFEYLQSQEGYTEEALLELVLVDQSRRWKSHMPWKVEKYLEDLPSSMTSNPSVLFQLAIGEYQSRKSINLETDIEELALRFPSIRERLFSHFRIIGKEAELISSVSSTIGGSRTVFKSIAADEDEMQTSSILFRDGGLQIKRLGRYQLAQVIGKGSFGLVYLAYDEELERRVAIKVPNAKRFDRPEHAKQYLNEARTVASLSHPNIVPVYDVGTSDDGLIYVVSKYIQGETLAERLKTRRLSYTESAELMATVAMALDHAHKRHLVHRDLKPGNILLEEEQFVPHVTDFGLAIREADYELGYQIAGTPAYMSPEQARGEGHRLDGRSDIFSMGTILYELLTGYRPFRGDSANSLLQQVISADPLPPRALEPSIPIELERVCMRALSKRASDRYATAQMMAEDLLYWNSNPTEEPAQTAIIPRGLRSFEAEDSGFFLELLPGPRNRNGLPKSIQFWKSRIEQEDPEKTFRVGLIYGPSGCGKSSMVKAGLLPNISEDVLAIYLEATPSDTENRILRNLRRTVPTLPLGLGLVESFTHLRRNEGQKVLIVIDQFEQWLHAYRAEQDTDLSLACRQCDGKHLQVILMIRDDFWMAATRFMNDVEVELVEEQNIAAVDLFTAKHAKKVLTAFGRAFGDLQETLTEENQDFINQTIHGLLQDGNVVSVQLAVFAEMIKGKPWTPETLRRIGGTKGIGVNFLEESFSSRLANPKHRQHQEAARAVLSTLLPELGSDIKGHKRSYYELLQASGYSGNLKEFDELIHILDRELRLITPIVKEHNDPEQADLTTSAFYQLTHDFLVPSLREWLTRKRQETKKGRAELKLEELTALWNAKPEERHLPSPIEYLNIRMYTDKKHWTEPQVRMMASARGVHGFQLFLVIAGLLVFVAYAFSLRNVSLLQKEKAEAVQIVKGLLQAETSQVPTIIDSLKAYRNIASDELTSVYSKATPGSNAQLHAALAILPQDPTVLPLLNARLLTVNYAQFPFVRDLLKDYKDELIEDYWKIASQENESQARFRAACALATYDPDNARWSDKRLGQFLARYLTKVEPSELLPWRNALRPIREKLIDPLSEIYRDNQLDPQSRNFATYSLADYLESDPPGLFDLLADADERQFEEIFSKLRPFERDAIEMGNAEIAKQIPSDAPENFKENQAIRQANSFSMLLRFRATDRIWPLLKQSPDPRTRSYIIHWLNGRSIEPQLLIQRLETETDPSIKQALMQCLGQLPITDTQKKTLSPSLLEAYQNDPDAGIHATTEWLLRQWNFSNEISIIDEKLKASLDAKNIAPQTPRNWFINSQGQTFVILPPGEIAVGSPAGEVGRIDNEKLHWRRIDRSMAISSKEVTHQQWRTFSKATPELTWPADQEQLNAYIPTDDSPMIGMTWYEAAWYCNWLSRIEGIPEDQWCYIPNESQAYAEGMKAKDRFWELQGYRLPTEVEWEYACRAQTVSSRYYGQSATLLNYYSWYQSNGDNRSHPVASLKPNDFGLFDMYGNVYEWCYDPLLDYQMGGDEGIFDHPKSEPVQDSERRICRGGSFFFPAFNIRSASRSSLQPVSRPNLTYGGFRPVRTISSATP